MLRRRAVLTGALGSAVLAVTGARAQEITFFRILTGETTGTYYAVGGLLATAISNPPGSLPCDQGGSCGVPGLVATSVASNGSIGNIADLAANRMQSALVQSDIAYWAYSSTGIYQGKPRVTTLRAIARLYPESIQLVASKKAGIASIRDLHGKRVSLDEENSGTQVDAKLILAAYGLGERDFQARYLPAPRLVDSVKDGSIDAFFRVVGWPGKAITDLAETAGIVLVPIDGPEAAKLVNQYKYFEPGEIPDNAYVGVKGVRTLNVNALWATTTNQPDDLIYGVTAGLWNPSARQLLNSGHAKGRLIRPETACKGLAIPLHPGAERFYKEQNLIK
ncbi:MAG TPA: TAXI family TRAP transporter solute-binding subunit [Stellaceae bacterium]|jgi:hypothetical protein|nr:TAXI family TRAP transporter solute-binding subunit [Stellaceae bacterium]